MFKKASSEEKQQRFEEKLLSKVAMSAVVEQRRGRRMKFIMFLLVLCYLPFVTLVLPKLANKFNGTGATTKEHIGVVDVQGMIASGTQANADSIVTGLRNALENEHTKAVMLRINSPGGSPVQSHAVFKEILRLRKLYPEKPVYAVIGDLGASGAYYIASAAENIYASESSIVGSIGVTSGGSFGFVNAMEKVGVERRIYTSGENKAFLDPFSPEKPADKERYEAMLKNVHEQFISAVKKGRQDRLKSDDIFNGFMWTGEESLPLGLIDGFGTVGSVARDEFDLDQFVNYTPKQDFLSVFAKKMGASVADRFIQSISPAPQFKVQ